ncbi:E3 ubiquitin-protein ligase TRAIP-like isoform X2 [Prorops nasuta]|uniref:E3 ubiquitin-protein ligase TRAIP-like isoform X2 n=1 Tax=Prorops nasuta TaxID=863751 RepID=UPI0034CD7844
MCILSDFLVPSADAFFTPCGHIFHFSCLKKWLERSKTCPQCREKTTDKKIHRAYFNFANNESINEETSSTLHSEIDNLKFQTLLKDKEISSYTTKISDLEKQTSGLRQKVHTLESDIQQKNSSIFALKEQTKLFKEQVVVVDILREENKTLKKEVTELRNVQKLINASSDEASNMVARTQDPKTLHTYISVLKREMNSSLDKRKDLRAKLTTIHQELQAVIRERNILLDDRLKKEQLEKETQLHLREICALKEKIYKLEKNKTDPSTKVVSTEEFKVSRNSNEGIKKTKLAVDSEKDELPLKQNEDSLSPRIPLKSGGLLSLHERRNYLKSTLGTNSSLVKKRKFASPEKLISKSSNCNGDVHYDGFGGHSKVDSFPKPIIGVKLKKSKGMVTTQKQIKFDIGKSLEKFMEIA